MLPAIHVRGMRSVPRALRVQLRPHGAGLYTLTNAR